MKNLNIPVGISDFEKIRNDKFYYVDKTGLIEKTNVLLDTEQKFICVSRPLWKNFRHEYAGKFL